MHVHIYTYIYIIIYIYICMAAVYFLSFTFHYPYQELPPPATFFEKLLPRGSKYPIIGYLVFG